MKNFAILIMSLGFGSLANAVLLNESDLPQLIESKNNHALGAKDQMTAAEKQTGHLTRSFLPKVEVRAGVEQFKTGSFEEYTQPFGGVEARINILNSGNDVLEETIRGEQLRAKNAKYSLVMRERLEKARTAYWNLVYQKELLTLLQTSVSDNEKNLTSALSRIRAGAATDTDRLEFEMYKTELEQDLARTKVSIENLQRELAVLTGLDPLTLETPTKVSHEHDDKLLSATLNPVEHPEVRSATSQASMASSRGSQAGRAWLPKVDLFANRFLYTFRDREYADQSNRWETVFGVQLSMQLFNGGNSYAESASLAAESAGLQKEANQTRAELQNEFENAKAELNLTHTLVHDAEITKKRNSRYLSRSMDEYRRGVKNSLDILNVSQRTLSVEKRYAEIRRDYQLSRAGLLSALGQ